MTATGPVFDPARSAALRDILHETVATTPRRPSRTRFAVLGGLIGAAVLLAGGTAALALSGALHFGSPEPAPAPATLTPSVTPTPTPTPTPTARPAVRVDPGVIAPHDVDALAAATRWSVDLPGLQDGCRMNPIAYSIGDGLSVFLSGARPKEYEQGGPCTETRDEELGLTLVDTTNGTVLWQRSWSYVSDRLPSFAGTRFQLLGTSGRAMFSSTDGTSAPHDVIDLTTGETVGSYDAAALFYGIAVPGSSGDIIVASPLNTVPTTISRVDPRDASEPRWVTTVDGTSPQIINGTRDATALPFYYWTDPETRNFGSIDVEAGTISAGPNSTEFSQALDLITLWTSRAGDGTREETAVDGAGNALWSAHRSGESRTVPVVVPGAYADSSQAAQNGRLAVVDDSQVAIVDQLTGRTIWTSDATGCWSTGDAFVTEVLDDASRNAFTVTLYDGTACALDRDTGQPLPDPHIPHVLLPDLGPANVYQTDWQSRVGTAYDRATGRVLWTLDLDSSEYWDFAGGYLVRLSGNTVRSLG